MIRSRSVILAVLVTALLLSGCAQTQNLLNFGDRGPTETAQAENRIPLVGFDQEVTPEAGLSGSRGAAAIGCFGATIAPWLLSPEAAPRVRRAAGPTAGRTDSPLRFRARARGDSPGEGSVGVRLVIGRMPRTLHLLRGAYPLGCAPGCPNQNEVRTRSIP